ncbi:MAG TPA: hypothetical protein VL358_08555 [Caulobacteraceae bacterium]|jgi:hypothetical protein|nr:hypothetical protein [Caulobacteraceae bacterium]
MHSGLWRLSASPATAPAAPMEPAHADSHARDALPAFAVAGADAAL